MKKLTLAALALFFLSSGFAQNEKYLKAMQDRVAVLDKSRDAAELSDISAAFARIADAEKSQWLPYYYGALAQVNAGYMIYTAAASKGDMSGLAKQLDPLAEKAELLLNKSEELSKDNSEIFAVKKMIATLRMMADPMSRYMQYGPMAQKALDAARKLNPENPRVYYLAGLDMFQTPEQYGGSKTEAKKLFEEALKKFESAKLSNSIEPHWGKAETQYFLSQIK
jgi:hypothetical protein